jgi:hypothetical protein
LLLLQGLALGAVLLVGAGIYVFVFPQKKER